MGGDDQWCDCAMSAFAAHPACFLCAHGAHQLSMVIFFPVFEFNPISRYFPISTVSYCGILRLAVSLCFSSSLAHLFVVYLLSSPFMRKPYDVALKFD